MALTSRLSRALRRCIPCPSHLMTTRTPAHRRRFTQHLSRAVQIYRSTSTDPYLNLSIEHHLLQRSHPDSTVLFLYTNRPCVVIGRNQNPWLEVNLHQLRQGLPPSSSQQLPDSPEPRSEHAAPSPEPIALVRRRSGGGAVFHDAGNTNWSVVCPPAAFDRDRHAEMVVRALARLGVRGARVNERHDIVVDLPSQVDPPPSTFKISGSAYKLTRARSLHHGTCLLRSPNLARVSGLLRSPAEGFIRARGVESVRSPIRNVGVGGPEFADAVVDEFRRMYGQGQGQGQGRRQEGGEREGRAGEEEERGGGGAGVVIIREEEALATDEVVRGLRELTSPEWIFGQTPLFTFSTHPTEEDPRERPEGARASLPSGFRAHFTIRHGEIQSAAIRGLRYSDSIDEASQDEIVSSALAKQQLHHVADWRTTLRQASPVPVDADGVGEWLNHMFGIQNARAGAGNSTGEGASLAEMTREIVADTAVGRFLDGSF